MPKRIALGSIGLTRDGQTVYPEIGTESTGKPFDFTAEELTQIAALEKQTGNQLVRKILNEGASDDTAAVTKTLGEMNLAELKAEAAAREVNLGDASTKAQIVAVLEAAEAEDL